jgi:hypothetical protein
MRLKPELVHWIVEATGNDQLPFYTWETDKPQLDAPAAVLAVAMPGWLEAMLQAPVRVIDHGNCRQVILLNAFKYGIRHQQRSCFSIQLTPDLEWIDSYQGSPNLANFDPLLPRETWWERVRSALIRRAYISLLASARGLLPCGQKTARSRLRVLAMCTARQAWRQSSLEDTLPQRLKASQFRPLIRKALALEPGLLALTRACRLCPKAHWVDQNFLSFVWQQRAWLERVRQQTPSLLPLAAEHAYVHGVGPHDAVASARAWLGQRGVKKQGYLLLQKHSATAFRDVLSRFSGAQALDALALALTLAQDDNGAHLPTPKVYAMLLDGILDDELTARQAIALFAKLPRRLLRDLRTYLHTLTSRREQRQATQQVALLVQWWNAQPDEQRSRHAQTGFKQLFALANAAERRRKAAQMHVCWPSPVTELQVGTLKAVAVNNALSLCDEGQRMKHCINNYLEECQRGELLVFHAHDAKRQQATIALEHTAPRWALQDVRGPCNTYSGKVFDELTDCLLAACNAPLGKPLRLLHATKALAELRASPLRDTDKDRWLEKLHSAKRQVVAAGSNDWRSPIQKFRMWFAKATPITNTLALYDEDQAMYNKVFTYAPSCEAGQMLAFHGEFKHFRGTFLDYSTILLRKSASGWEVHEIHMQHRLRILFPHYQNQFAQGLADACNAAERESPSAQAA